MNNYLCRIYRGTLQYISLVETMYSAIDTSIKSQEYKIIQQFYYSNEIHKYDAGSEGSAVQSMLFDQHTLLAHIFNEMER